MQGMVAGVGVGGQSRLWFYKDVTVPPPSIRMLQQHLHIPKACKFRKYRRFNRSSIIQGSFRVEASGADFGTNIYEENEDKNPQKKSSIDESRSENVSEPHSLLLHYWPCNIQEYWCFLDPWEHYH